MTSDPVPFGSMTAALRDDALRRIADELGEPIEIVRDLDDALACCAAEGPMEAHGERVQRAREAGLDAGADVLATPDTDDRISNAVETAIETAIRIRVDADVMTAVREAHPDVMIKSDELRNMIETAFAAAGFEVEK